MIYAVIDTNVLVSALFTSNVETATVKEDAYLVTGNTKHFPKSPIVVTPAEMVQIILDQNE